MPYIYFILAFLLGSTLGSFLNAWMYRTRQGKSVLHGRSHCPHCDTQLLWYHLIPILSFWYLRGRCGFCKKPISWQYPLVELWMALACVSLLAFHAEPASGFSIWFFFDVLIIFILTFLFVYDLRFQELPFSVTVGAAVIIGTMKLMSTPSSWASLLMSAAVGGGFFFAQYLFSRGRWIGSGDIYLGILMGVILGWPLIFVALFLAYISGALWSLILLARAKKTLHSTTPFGTYLTVATVVTMMWGENILEWYIGLL